MKFYMNEQGLLAKERELYLGLGGIEDLIKEIDAMRDTFQEVQDRYEKYEKVYHSDMRNMLEEIVKFNQSFLRTHEAWYLKSNNTH